MANYRRNIDRGMTYLGRAYDILNRTVQEIVESRGISPDIALHFCACVRGIGEVWVICDLHQDDSTNGTDNEVSPEALLEMDAESIIETFNIQDYDYRIY